MNPKTFAASFLLLATTAPLPLLAHPGHEHETKPAIDQQAAGARAQEEVVRLIAKKKLDASWKDGALKSVEKKPGKKRWEWLVTLENAAAPKEKILYVFLKPSGAFVAANFTGK